MDGLNNKDHDFFEFMTKDTPDIFILLEAWCSEEETCAKHSNFTTSNTIVCQNAESSARGRKKGGIIFGIKNKLQHTIIIKRRGWIEIIIQNIMQTKHLQ